MELSLDLLNLLIKIGLKDMNIFYDVFKGDWIYPSRSSTSRPPWRWFPVSSVDCLWLECIELLSGEVQYPLWLEDTPGKNQSLNGQVKTDLKV